MQAKMEDSNNAIESKVIDLINDIFRADAVQEALHNILDGGFGEKAGGNGIAKLCSDLKTFFAEEGTQKEILKSVGQDPPNQKPGEQKDNNQLTHEVGIKAIVNHLAGCRNHLQAQLVTQILHYLANQKLVAAKIICFALLGHELLKPENAIFWLVSFKLIKHIIPGVDYKGVREIMKSCLERARLLHAYLKHSELEQTDAICEVLETIFDRNASLLPGYFIINELLKLYPDYKTWPHWRLSRMLTNYVDDFKKAAQMLSIIGRDRLRPIVEHSGHTSPNVNSWKLDCSTLKFPLKGALPYWDSLQEPQYGLVRHILRQPSSKEMVTTILDLQKKQRCPILEDQLVDLIIESLEECAAYDAMCASMNSTKGFPSTTGASNENASSDINPSSTIASSTTTLDSPKQCYCNHITSLLINFVLNQLIVFKSLVLSLHEKLKKKPVSGGRDHLMWSLLQFLSGTIAKNPVSDFQPVLRLIELLYPEREPLPVPDCSDPRCALQLSAMCILIHILRKAQSDNLKTPQILPPAFISHHELLQNLVHNPQVPLIASGFPNQAPPDYRIGLLLNAYSTNQEVYHRPIWALSEVVVGSQKSTVPMPGSNCIAYASTCPFSMSFLDSLTIHVKMSLLQNISAHISKPSHSKSTVALAPALFETYARLLVYSETENIGLKQYINPLLPAVFKNQTWGILHALLEMFTYRIHRSPPQYRIQLLSTIHHIVLPLNTMPNMNQLHLCMESSALRLITGLGNTEVMPSLTRFFSTDSKQNIISSESEELNRVIVLTMARAIHVTGCDSSGESARWCVDFLKSVMHQTPHTWATHTLQSFPPVINEFYQQHGAPRDTHNLKKAVEEEYRKWKSMSNENDIIAHFSLQQNTSNLFLCLLFKMVFETARVPAEAYKVLERLGPRQLMAHARTLCDFLVLEFSNSSLGQQISKYVDTMNAIIWQYNIIPIDRLILCLALRTQEGSSEAQVCLFIIQLLLLRPSDFRNRVQEFVNENSPEHWKQNNWYEKHMAFHRKFPEKFSPESLMAGQGSLSTQHQTLPIYFSNVCLRFLPVLDIMIYRFLEVCQVHKRLETVLEQLGSLYKFHDRPITYLYNTLHYYEEKLRDSPILKRQLVGAVIMSQKDIRPPKWALSEEYINYLGQSSEEITWIPSLPYYFGIVKRLVQTMQGKPIFPQLEWRFNEFANCNAHALHITCVELMALPSNPSIVANMLMDSVLKCYYEIPSEELMDYVNAVGLIITWLPESYWSIVHIKVVNLLQTPELASPTSTTLGVFTLLNLQALLPTWNNIEPSLTLAIIHSFWHHASFSQVGKIPTLMKEQIRPILQTEEQLVALCHLVAPFLQRFNTELARKVFDATVELYQALAVIDKKVKELHYQDAICDLLYHIKYMITGDYIKTELETIIRGLRSSLKLRLRFITHLNIEAIESSSSDQTHPEANGNVSSSTSSTADTLAPKTISNPVVSSIKTEPMCPSSSSVSSPNVIPSGNSPTTLPIIPGAT